jgi:hypothetical protein
MARARRARDLPNLREKAAKLKEKAACAPE